jgi:hypothetical protein
MPSTQEDLERQEAKGTSMQGVRMNLAIAILVAGSALAATAAPARAQQLTPVPVPSIEQRSEELSTWLKEYRAWEKWFELWGNRVARNGNDLPIWDRKKRPEPPVWLAAVCRDEIMVDEQLASACNILWTWDEQPLQIIRRRGSSVATSGGKSADTVVKSSFFQRIHLTGLWVRAQYPGTPVYGVVGMQIGVLEIGRLTLPATGVMLVALRDSSGGYAWKPATTVGFGYRLFDFVPPLKKKPFSLHLNVASTHILGLRDERVVSRGANVSFVGFSVSGRKGR